MWRASVIMPSNNELLVYTAVYVTTGKPVSLVIEVAGNPVIVAAEWHIGGDMPIQCEAEKLQQLRRCLADHLASNSGAKLDLLEHLLAK